MKYSERLEDIKERFMKYEYDYNLSGEDVEWLIEQAERVQDLKIMLKVLGERNQRYKQALEYIRELAEYDEYENTVEQLQLHKKSTGGNRMNLQKLFELQKQLDEHIYEEHPVQDGEDRLAKKILALQVELGELANEWRGFKYWSKDQEPRIKDYKQTKCKWCNGSGDDGTGVCPDCRSSGDVYKEYNPLLEEYVDCLHFILSIGLEKDFVKLGYNESAVEGMKRKDITSQFNYLFDKVGDFSSIPNHNNYMYIVSLFIGLGEMLGFTWEQIEQAYLNKNNINHQRQEENY